MARVELYCVAAGCGNYAQARGLCPQHYQHLRKRTMRGTCAVEGCERAAPERAGAMCQMHYMRWFRHGDPTIVKPGAIARSEMPNREHLRAHVEAAIGRLVKATPWMADAACKNRPTDLFFPQPPIGRPKDGTTNVTRAYEHAKAVCATCPVAGECLSYALDENIPAGVFGGATPKERAAMRKEMSA